MHIFTLAYDPLPRVTPISYCLMYFFGFTPSLWLNMRPCMPGVIFVGVSAMDTSFLRGTDLVSPFPISPESMYGDSPSPLVSNAVIDSGALEGEDSPTLPHIGFGALFPHIGFGAGIAPGSSPAVGSSSTSAAPSGGEGLPFGLELPHMGCGGGTASSSTFGVAGSSLGLAAVSACVLRELAPAAADVLRLLNAFRAAESGLRMVDETAEPILSAFFRASLSPAL
mmetsp:Transcript_23690/g.58810  ORF Transcript_23690/g.58810 Transcript_23690/m.58810 type:complete len:225 (-) Transcript_23690:103-777(-)